MNIGIFGGSFNPIHKGHVNIAKNVIKKLNLNTLFFVPNYESIFKKCNLEKAEHRINMIKLHLENNMKISMFEINNKKKTYTIETINYFKNKYKKANLFLIIGSDQIAKLNKWKKIKNISNIVKIIIYKRSEKVHHINIKKYNCKILDNQIYNYSSTSLRNGDFSNISNEVANYIGQNQLYAKEILSKMVIHERYKHSIAVGQFAIKLAKKNNYNIQKAWIAGLFHDITKNWTKEKHYQFLEKNGINDKKIPEYKLHSLTGSIWINKIYKIQDINIINAIKNHTSLNKELSLLDKIIYASDKLCIGRKFVDIQKDRKLIFNNLNIGFKNIVQKKYAFFKKNKSLTKEEEIIYKKWKT